MTALNTPTIWTPRAGPWWRLPRWADIAQYAKKLQFKDGKLAIKNGKPVITEEGNPCCCGGDCITVVFENTQLVDCSTGAFTFHCTSGNSIGGVATRVDSDWDGVYTLCRATPGVGTYLYEDTTSAIVDLRRSCDRDVQCVMKGIQIFVDPLPGSFRVQARHNPTLYPRVTGSFIFYGEVSDTASPLVATNNLSSIGWDGDIAEDVGTATIIL